MPPRIPHLLLPYLHPPPDSLVLVSSVLGASTNWLLLRFLGAAIADPQSGHDASSAGPEDEPAVVLVSFLRDLTFWKTEAKRTSGIDLERLAQQKRFAFVDGLSDLCLPPPSGRPAENGQSPATPARHLPLHTQALRNSPAQGRAEGVTSPSSSAMPLTATPPKVPSITHAQSSSPSLKSTSVEHFTDTLIGAIGSLAREKIVLLIDSPDVVLSIASVDSGTPHKAAKGPRPDDPTAAMLSASILQLRKHVSSAIVALGADAPLAFVSATSTPLESEHGSLLLGLAHQASHVMSLRLLDTGFAKDVSGVLKISSSAVEEGQDAVTGFEGQHRAETEMLYFVAGDGSVKVFERGAGDGTG